MLLPCEATLLRPDSPTIHLPRLPWHPVVTRCFCGAFLARRSRLCFLKMNQTAVLFPSPPLHYSLTPRKSPLYFFLLSPLYEPCSARSRPAESKSNASRRGSGHSTSRIRPIHSSSLRATPLSFSRARYSSTRSRLPSPAR